MGDHAVGPVDAFDLPDWLGVAQVTWSAAGSLRGDRVAGRLESGSGALDCDVLACDQAHPVPVLADAWRSRAHLAWSLGEVLLVEYDGRLTLAAPGAEVTVDAVLEAVRRLARAVGADASRFSVLLRL